MRKRPRRRPRMMRRLRVTVMGAVCVVAAVACKRPPTPVPATEPATAPSDSALASGSAAPAAAAPSVTASFAPPDHWSTVTYDPKTDPLFRTHAAGTFFVAVTIESDDGPEGDLYLERTGDALFGRWGLTVVDGKVTPDGKTFSLRDVGTEQTIFEGRLEGGQLTGVIGAESALRRVQSLPARPIAETTFKLTHSEGPRLLTIEVQRGEVKRATFSTSGKNAKKGVPFVVRPEADRFVVRDDQIEWALWPTAAGVVGRSATGQLVRQDHGVVVEEPKPLPFTRGALTLGATRLRQGKPNTKCDIDIELPTVKGIPNAEAIEKALQRSVIDAGMGMWPSGEPPPTLASFACQKDPFVDIQIQSASTVVTPLPGGFLGLEVKGYARFSSMGGVTAVSDCLLLDANEGEIVPDLLNKLPDEVTEVVRVQADRSLKREMRSAKLDRDDFYLVESLERISSGMSVCPTGKGLRLLIPLGTITKNIGGSGPMAVDIQGKHLLPHFPSGHRFRALFDAR